MIILFSQPQGWRRVERRVAKVACLRVTMARDEAAQNPLQRRDPVAAAAASPPSTGVGAAGRTGAHL